MRRKPQQKRAQLAVESIIEAGFIALAKHGSDHTTTVHIAAIAGISPGTLYQYFANKEEVYDAMERHFVDEILAMLKDAVPELIQIDIRNAITQLLHRFSDMLLRDDSRYLKYIRHTVHRGRAGHTKRVEKALMDFIMQYVMNHPELIRLRHIPTLSYIIINGGIFSIITHLSDPNPPITFEQLIEGLGTMAVSYIDAEMRPESL